MSMFPSPLGRDYNPDRFSREGLPEDGSAPKQMRWGFILAILGAVIMLVSGLVLLTSVGTSRTEVPADVVDTYVMNQRIVAWGNIVCALALAALSPQLLKGRHRRWWTGFLVIAIITNSLGMFVQVAGTASLIVVALLAFSAVFVFRPVCNRFIRVNKEQTQ